MAYISIILAFALGYLLALKKQAGQIDLPKVEFPKFTAQQKKIVQVSKYEPRTLQEEVLDELENNKKKIKVFYAR